MELVPIKVKIRRAVVTHGKYKGAVHNLYPEFDQLRAEVRAGLPWKTYVETVGVGWVYDHVCSHGHVDTGNPEVPEDHEHKNSERWVWHGVLLVEPAFAEAAVAAFDDVSILSEASLESFYEDRAAVSQPEVIYDLEALQAIQCLEEMEYKNLIDKPSAKEKRQRKDALDPDVQTEIGRRRNLDRRYATWKARRGIVVRQANTTTPPSGGVEG